MTVETDGGGAGTAITFDVSATGMRIACPGRLAIGARVRLRFRVTDEGEDRLVPATVLRVEENPGEDGPWRYRMAVQFDEPQPDLEGILETHGENAV